MVSLRDLITWLALGGSMRAEEIASRPFAKLHDFGRLALYPVRCLRYGTFPGIVGDEGIEIDGPRHRQGLDIEGLLRRRAAGTLLRTADEVGLSEAAALAAGGGQDGVGRRTALHPGHHRREQIEIARTFADQTVPEMSAFAACCRKYWLRRPHQRDAWCDGVSKTRDRIQHMNMTKSRSKTQAYIPVMMT